MTLIFLCKKCSSLLIDAPFQLYFTAYLCGGEARGTQDEHAVPVLAMDQLFVQDHVLDPKLHVLAGCKFP